MSYKPIPITTKLAAMRANASALKQTRREIRKIKKGKADPPSVPATDERASAGNPSAAPQGTYEASAPGKNLNKGYGLTPDSSLKQTEKEEDVKADKPPIDPDPAADKPAEKGKDGMSGMMDSVKGMGESKLAEAKEQISMMPGMGGKKAKRQETRAKRRADRRARKAGSSPAQLGVHKMVEKRKRKM